jgi:hypothetical protein
VLKLVLVRHGRATQAEAESPREPQRHTVVRRTLVAPVGEKGEAALVVNDLDVPPQARAPERQKAQEQQETPKAKGRTQLASHAHAAAGPRHPSTTHLVLLSAFSTAVLCFSYPARPMSPNVATLPVSTAGWLYASMLSIRPA